MASEVVDGCVIPVRVAGHPVLELCNTGAGWPDPAGRSGRLVPAKDYLVDARTYLVWAHAVGLIDGTDLAAGTVAAAADPVVANRAVGEAIRVREALYRLFTAHGDAESAGAAIVVQRAAAGAVRASRLCADEVPAARRWTLDGGTDPLRRPTRRLVIRALDLLADLEPGTIGRCAGAGCGWLFLAQNGRRRWCLMPICGNRAKARRHAERVRGSAGPPSR